MMIPGEQATCTHNNIADKKLKQYYITTTIIIINFIIIMNIIIIITMLFVQLLYLCFATHRCMCLSVNMHDLAMHAERNRWSLP